MTRSRETGNVGYSASRENLVINGDFRIKQRYAFTSGATGITVDNLYVADRWRMRNGFNLSGSISGQVLDIYDANLPGGYGKVLRTTSNSNVTDVNGFVGNDHFIEDVTTANSQTITVSFYARVSTGTRTFNVGWYQLFGVGGATPVAGGQSITIDTTFRKYVCTFQIPSTSGKAVGDIRNALIIALRSVSKGNNSDVFVGWDSIPDLPNGHYTDIAYVKVEIGDTATEFLSRPYAQELAMCQRYCFVTDPGESGQLGRVGVGYWYGASGAQILVHHPVTMRDAPTVGYVAGGGLSDFRINIGTGTSIAVPTGLDGSFLTGQSKDSTLVRIIYGTAGQTPGTPTTLMHSDTNTTNGLVFNAEF